MTTQTSLAKAFNARQSFFAHRSSAMFPLKLDDACDLHIVFLNYWLVKNDIAAVGVNFRIYATDGTLMLRHQLEEVALHNNISVRGLLLAAVAADLPFEGMVEVEIVSAENLKFTFPAILGIYEANGFYSSVHSAGRVKNTDERKVPTRSRETNWTCKFASSADAGYDVAPFFHYFVGAAPVLPDETITLTLHDNTGTALQSRDIRVGEMEPFASRIFLADEVLDLAETPPEGAFLSVELTAYDIFPRLVVGNYHRLLGFLEVTHSFPKTEFEDYCPVPDAQREPDTFGSLLTAQTTADLNLAIRVFPTNCRGVAEAVTSTKTFESPRLEPTGKRESIETAPGSPGLFVELADGQEMSVLHLRGEEIPSRLNASYAYSVRNSGGRFSTDIATGAKSSVYPPKGRHWGHGCLGGGFDTRIMFHNNTHTPSRTMANTGTLRILGEDVDVTVPVTVGAEACITVELAAALQRDKADGPVRFFSWMLTMANPVGETFWVAFREDGAVFGEHGF